MTMKRFQTTILALVEDEYNTIRGELELGDDPVRSLNLVRGP